MIIFRSRLFIIGGLVLAGFAASIPERSWAHLPSCNADPGVGIGCISRIDKNAFIVSNGQSDQRELSKTDTCELRPGDRFWVNPGNTAVLTWYRPRGKGLRPQDPVVDHQVLDYTIATYGARWDQGKGEYSAAEKRLLRRELHLAGVSKATGLGDSEDSGPVNAIAFPPQGDTIQSTLIPVVLAVPNKNTIGELRIVIHGGGRQVVYELGAPVLTDAAVRRLDLLVLIDVTDVGLDPSQTYDCVVTMSDLDHGPSRIGLHLHPTTAPTRALAPLIKALASDDSSLGGWDHVCGAFQSGLDATSYGNVFLAIEEAAHEGRLSNLFQLPAEANARVALMDFANETGISPAGILQLLLAEPLKVVRVS